MKKQEAKIGLEVHIPLNTKSKLFCGCSTRSEKANEKVCEICLGLPGSKPFLNEAAVMSAQKLGFALGCNVQNKISFSRKTYLYPDLVKGFQITQLSEPIALGGIVSVGNFDIKIRRLQLEEDPGSLKHTETGSLIDYNRSGIALVELVSEPDFENADQVILFLDFLKSVLDYLGLLREDLAIRADVNVSILGGERVEIKNLSGSDAIKRSVAFEVLRQKKLVSEGKSVSARTVHYDAERDMTIVSREKEDEAEYGYIPEPDLPTLVFSEEELGKIKASIPELPHQKISRFIKDYGLREEDARTISSEIEIAQIFEKLAGKLDVGFVTKWMVGPLKKVLNYNEKRFVETRLTYEIIFELLEKLDSGELTPRAGELVLREITIRNVSLDDAVSELGFEIKGNMDSSVEEVLAENPKVVKDYISGKEKALHFLVGKVIKKVGGQADTKRVIEILIDKLKRLSQPSA